MSNFPSEIREYEVEDLEAFMGEETELYTQTGDGFDLHPQSQSTADSLNDLRRLCHIPPEVEMVVPEPYESPESGREGYCCAYEIYIKGCGLFFPFPRYFLFTSTIWESPSLRCRPTCSGILCVPSLLQRRRVIRWDLASSWNSSRPENPELLGPQIRPVPSVYFLNFYKVVLERPGRIREADKKVKDQISLIGRDKKNASSSGDDKIYRKTLLVDDGSLEGSKSMAVTINNAPSSTLAADNMIAAPTEEEGPIGDSSFTKKRKAEGSELPLQGRSKSTRKDRAIPSNLSTLESAEAQDRNPDSGTATLDMNSIINHYEEELVKVSKRAANAEGEIEKLQSSNQLVKETAGLDSAHRKEIERLERSGEETEQKLKTALADHDFAKGEIELLRSELSKVKTVDEELERKNESLSKLKDQDVRKISHDARKEETVGAELAETEAKLATAPQPYLDLQQFASEFADSPPLTEPNTCLSVDEMVLTGFPHAHFNEFGTNVDKISSGRTQGFTGQDAPISSIMGDVFESSSEPPQDASLLNPEVVLVTQDATAGGATPVSSQVGDEGGSPMNE
ncbi:hypothetical protein ISN45_Aa08g009010 [Arabidopsis thaliana x Arabidopsis arenosa]|uniref:Uncharacterized protein n=1 Tax=Arabidopsis thaliana x Arabidopsis arenosa TaxID=1240361 RepID=A0A8T1XGM5_9BRAS|nr:hypothetical protein ISN45_Aa08g009010 [Arabidopsis thaliana x Arabidopsis arenosa]